MRFRDLTKLPEEEIDLGRASLLLATLEYPDLDLGHWLLRLDEMAATVDERASSSSGDFARLSVLTDYLYDELGIQGNEDDYYDPRNSFLSDVIERRLGIPISLAVLLIEVGRRAGVPLIGISLPGHFLVRHAAHLELVLDPFDGGRILTHDERAEILRRVLGSDAVFRPEMMQPVGARQILARMHHNLRNIYLERREFGQATRVIDRLTRLEPGVGMHRRDRGVLRLHAEDPRGIKDLEHYLAEADEVPDREEMEALLDKARRKLTAVH